MNEHSAGLATRHRWVDVDGVRVFYRERGPSQAPVLLLPHGYPSFAISCLPWRTGGAPSLPTFQGSDTARPPSRRSAPTPSTATRPSWTVPQCASLERFAIYLHDYGSRFGLRLAIAAPEKVTALIIPNGDIYEDQLGPKYEPLREFWNRPTEEGMRKLGQHVSKEGFRDEFIYGGHWLLETNFAEVVPLVRRRRGLMATDRPSSPG